MEFVTVKSNFPVRTVGSELSRSNTKMSFFAQLKIRSLTRPLHQGIAPALLGPTVRLVDRAKLAPLTRGRQNQGTRNVLSARRIRTRGARQRSKTEVTADVKLVISGRMEARACLSQKTPTRLGLARTKTKRFHAPPIQGLYSDKRDPMFLIAYANQVIKGRMGVHVWFVPQNLTKQVGETLLVRANALHFLKHLAVLDQEATLVVFPSVDLTY